MSNTRGNWVAANGNYSAQQPNNNPVTFSGLPYQLKDFNLSMDINDIADGGVWLRCSPDAQNGVLLVTGGVGLYDFSEQTFDNVVLTLGSLAHCRGGQALRLLGVSARREERGVVTVGGFWHIGRY